MPHINLIYPYLEDTGSVFDKEAPKLLRQLASLRKFKVTLNQESFGYFAHGGNSTVWLKPVQVKETSPLGGKLNWQAAVAKPPRVQQPQLKVKVKTNDHVVYAHQYLSL